MKTSAVLTSLLFGSFAAAAPFDRRALVYKTEVVTETVVVYTTVWDYDESVAQATTTPAGYFYEQPKAPSSAVAEVTPTPKAPVAEKPSVAPVASSPATTPSPSAVPTPTPAPYSAPAPVVEQSKAVEEPKPTKEAEPTTAAPTTAAPQPTTTTSAYVAPPATTQAAAPAASSSAPSYSTPSTGGAMEHQNVDITIYDIAEGDLGACGTELKATDMIVALAASTWGASTYDVMTGASTNPWCGQKIKVEYKGNEVDATIMDLCPGCSGADIDLSPAVWKALTGLDEKTRLKASWSKSS
jgi:hypothetical protein